MWNENLGGVRHEVAPRYRAGNNYAPDFSIIDLLGPPEDTPELVSSSGSSEDAQSDVITNVDADDELL